MFISPHGIESCYFAFCHCILRVLVLFIYWDQTVYTALFTHHVRKEMLRASVAALPIVERNMQNTRTKHVFGVDLRRNGGFINVISAFPCCFQCQFACFVSFL